MHQPLIHTRTYRLRYYEMNAWGEATPLTILNLFEETAFTHCEKSGWDVYKLRANGLGWVLLRGCVQMKRYPAHREDITVETWMSASRLFYGQREYVLRGDRGDVMGAARSLWLFYSLERKRPIPVLPEILAAWGPEGTRSIDKELEEVSAPGLSCIDATRMYDVRGSDIDTNGHVNNINYMEWALEAVPREVYDTCTMMSAEGQYIKEVRYGQRVWPALQALPSAETPSFTHGVFVRKDDGGMEAVATARTVWAERGARAKDGADARTAVPARSAPAAPQKVAV
jgi:medium-chain acyl-[acyl-carrier-protein] hydrolase